MTIHSIINAFTLPLIGIKNYIIFIDRNRKSASPKLFLDMTELHFKDSKTGVQRVTKNIADYIHKHIKNYEVVDVHAKKYGGGFYDCNSNAPVKIQRGDFFFGLDLSIFLIPQNRRFLNKMKKMGIPVWFYIHDMIPVSFPDTVDAGVRKHYPCWLKTIINYTGIVGNSQSTINELKDWISEHNPDKLDYLSFGFSYLGYSDNMKKSFTDYSDTQELNFIMVSTVEPRKRYDLAIKGFEILWNEGIDANLVIVGRPGWNNEDTINKLKSSSYSGSKLLWYDNGISDESLAELYTKSAALIFCSEAEGFGLPIIEAAAHQKHLILRDIPIFREIAGEKAFYFPNSNDENKFAKSIKDWITLFKNGDLPQKLSVEKNSWEDCSEKVCQILGLA